MMLPRLPDIDPQEIEKLIMDLGAIGCHSTTGVWRTTYSPEWVAANDWLRARMEAAGLATRMDAVGNLWGRIEGREGGKAVVSGSHIDTQCPGGRYDGALGILAALAAVKALTSTFGQPRCPVEVLSLCEEESSRFPRAEFWGSRGIVGRIGAGDTDKVTALDGGTIGDAMRAIGLDPARCAEARRDDIAAFIELHIEQGPVLEDAGLAVGVVDAITGMRHIEIVLEGQANHAGAFPMDLRHDPMMGAAEIITACVGHAEDLGRPAVTTIGKLEIEPGGAAIIPQKVRFTIDARHPDPAAGVALHAHHATVVAEVAAKRGLTAQSTVVADHIPVQSAPQLVSLLQASAQAQGIKVMQMASGAGHDSQQMAEICPVAMVFVRSEGGRSHTPEEFSAIEDIVEGIRVLCGALYQLAWA